MFIYQNIHETNTCRLQSHSEHSHVTHLHKALTDPDHNDECRAQWRGSGHQQVEKGRNGDGSSEYPVFETAIGKIGSDQEITSFTTT